VDLTIKERVLPVCLIKEVGGRHRGITDACKLQSIPMEKKRVMKEEDKARK
jgi:hypothetical protein